MTWLGGFLADHHSSRALVRCHQLTMNLRGGGEVCNNKNLQSQPVYIVLHGTVLYCTILY